MSCSISCIIPFYNDERYLERSIKSVLSQSFTDFELIMIDDGSTDKSYSIALNFSKQDNRIKIIQQENLGVSVARNKGIERAKGEYIFFLDADDKIKKNTFEKLYKNASQHSSDILIFDHFKVYNTRIKPNKRYLTEDYLYSSINDKKLILKSGVTPWNKLYSAKFLYDNNIRFQPSIYYEDIPFFWECIILAKRVFYLDNRFYFYYQHSKSIMNSKFSLQKINDIIFAMLIVKINLERHKVYLEYQDIFELKIIKTFIDFFAKRFKEKKEIYYLMNDKISFIDLQAYKGKLSIVKYLKYKVFLSRNYVLYRILFCWF